MQNQKLNWKSQPFVEHPRRTIFLVIFLVAIGVCVYLSFGLYWVIIAYILLVGGILPYWLPTYYCFDEEGVKVKGIIAERNKKWDEFRSYYKDKNGVLLSPFSKPTRLENFRGIYIRFNNNEKEVVNFISTHINNKGSNSFEQH